MSISPWFVSQEPQQFPCADACRIVPIDNDLHPTSTVNAPPAACAGSFLSRYRAAWTLPLALLVFILSISNIALAQGKAAGERARDRKKSQAQTEGSSQKSGAAKNRGGRPAQENPSRDSDDGFLTDEQFDEYQAGPLAKLVGTIRESQEALSKIDDYTAQFTRKELVKRRLVSQSMEMKYRHKPFSVYLRFTSPDEAGREVIYVDGGFRNKLVVHETGLKAIAGTLQLAINDPKVMQESRYPITSVGIHNILKKTIQNLPRDAADPDIQVKRYPSATFDDIECIAYVIKHPEPREGIPFHETRLYFDKTTLLPIHVERYDWPRRQGDKLVLVEEYTYKNIRTNVGHDNTAFDPRNPKYSFP